MIQIHQIKPKIKRKRKKRIGRGGKRGTFSGRGIKGQKARAGHRIRPQLRDIIKKLPKKRGYHFKSFRIKSIIVNLKDIDEKFKDGAIVAPKTLLESGLISKIKGRLPKVKILGGYNLKKKLIFKDVEMSKSVKEQLT